MKITLLPGTKMLKYTILVQTGGEEIAAVCRMADTSPAVNREHCAHERGAGKLRTKQSYANQRLMTEISGISR